MMDSKSEYLHLLYKEALNQVRCYIDSRYKILQFIGFYNGAVLTFGFSKDVQVLSIAQGSVGGIIVSCLSLLVAVMGISTEFSLISYNKAYFHVIRRIEEELNDKALKETGTFTYGTSQVGKHFAHRMFPVNRAHRFFYLALAVFWGWFLIFQVTHLPR
jgi:hypothetical protein